MSTSKSNGALEVRELPQQVVETVVEEVERQGERLSQIVLDLLREGMARKVVVRNYDGQTMLEIPFSAAVAGGILLTTWLRLRGIVMLAIAAALGHVYFSLERYDEVQPQKVVTKPPIEVESVVMKKSAPRKSAAPAKKATKSTKSTKSTKTTRTE